MANDTDDVVVDLDALDAEVAKGNGKAPPDEPEIKIEEAKPAAKETLSTEEGLEKLKKQLADETKARESADVARADAERRADEASKAEVAARTESQDNRLHLVTNAIATVTQANDVLETKYAEALAAQDFPAAAKVQREMTTNSAKLLQLETGKAALEKAPKPTIRPPTDPVEQFVAPMTQQSADWVRAHPEFARDPKKTRKMIRAHEDALDDGMRADTPAYFSYIEKTLGLAPPDDGGTVVDTGEALSQASTAAAKGRQVAPASAPVSRSGNGAGKRPESVTLSPAEVEMAGNMGMTVQEYARNKVALKKDGKLN